MDTELYSWCIYCTRPGDDQPWYCSLFNTALSPGEIWTVLQLLADVGCTAIRAEQITLDEAATQTATTPPRRSGESLLPILRL